MGVGLRQLMSLMLEPAPASGGAAGEQSFWPDGSAAYFQAFQPIKPMTSKTTSAASRRRGLIVIDMFDACPALLEPRDRVVQGSHVHLQRKPLGGRIGEQRLVEQHTSCILLDCHRRWRKHRDQDVVVARDVQ